MDVLHFRMHRALGAGLAAKAVLLALAAELLRKGDSETFRRSTHPRELEFSGNKDLSDPMKLPRI
jgi:hypothetical protein